MKQKLLAGITLTTFIVATLFIAFPAKSQFDGTIKIGIVGPMAWIQGRGMAQGAKLSAKQINDAGGIKVNYAGPGWTYSATKKAWKVEIVLADTLRGMPDPTAATGTAAAMELVSAGVDYVIGFFRTEATMGGREVLADAKIPLMIAGAATNELIDCAGKPTACCGSCVRDNYARYKYQFRATPQNSTTLFYNIGYYLKYVITAKLMPIFGTPLKIAVISEDLTWADVMHLYMASDTSYPGTPYPYWYIFWNVLLGLGGVGGVTKVYSARVSPVATDISSELLAAKAAGAKLVVEVLSGPVGRTCAIQFSDLGIPGVLSGIDVPGQEIPLHWTATAGKCEYESFLAAAGTKTPVTPKYVAYWDLAMAEYGEAPIYTSGGVYDAVLGFAETIEEANKWPNDSPDERVPYIERTLRVVDRSDVLPPFTRGTGMMGTFKFTTAAAVNVSTGPGTLWQIAPYLGTADADLTTAWNNFRTAYNATWTNGTHGALDVNPNTIGTLHELFMSPETYSPLWTSPFYARSQVTQWQADPITGEGKAEVFFPMNMPYSKNFKIPPWTYSHAATDIAKVVDTTLVAQPDGAVDDNDMDVAKFCWLSKPGDAAWVAGGQFYGLVTDQDGNNFINIADVSAVAKEYGYSAITEYGQWPLP